MTGMPGFPSLGERLPGEEIQLIRPAFLGNGFAGRAEFHGQVGVNVAEQAGPGLRAGVAGGIAMYE